MKVLIHSRNDLNDKKLVYVIKYIGNFEIKNKNYIKDLYGNRYLHSYKDSRIWFFIYDLKYFIDSYCRFNDLVLISKDIKKEYQILINTLLI